MYYIYDVNGEVMVIYMVNLGIINYVSLKEQYIYGVLRLGLLERDLLVFLVVIGVVLVVKYKFGLICYEISNYLGNVNQVIMDCKIKVLGIYQVIFILKVDYYFFGMEMLGCYVEVISEGYCFGYNGMEKDLEIKLNGNFYIIEFRQYDLRFGRWLLLDLLKVKYFFMSFYVVFNDNLIIFKDL